MLERKKRVVTSRGDLIRINDELRKVATRDGDKCKYNVGWDDARVAEVLGLPVTQVKSARREFFGNLPNAGGGIMIADARRELDALRERAEQQEKIILNMAHEIEELRSRYNKLVQTLALNGTPSVRHLEWKPTTPPVALPQH